MSKEKEDIEFEELLADKRHRELSGALKGIATLLNKPPDKSVSDAIERLVAKLGEMKPPEMKMSEMKTPDVKVEVNTKDFVTSVDNLASGLLAELKKFNERPIVDSFKLETGNWGQKIVRVIYKK